MDIRITALVALMSLWAAQGRAADNTLLPQGPADLGGVSFPAADPVPGPAPVEPAPAPACASRPGHVHAGSGAVVRRRLW